MVQRMFLGDRLQNIPWWWIILCGFLALIANDEITHIVDSSSDGEGWMRAHVEVVGPGYPPDLKYGVCATRLVDGVWTASLWDERGRRLDSRKGDGDYSKPDTCLTPKIWTWHDFFTGYRPDPPSPPTIPYRVCVSYRMTVPSGVTRDSRRFCSDLYDPTEDIFQ